MKQCRPGANGNAAQVDYKSHLHWALAMLKYPFRLMRTGTEIQIGASANSVLAGGVHGWSSATSVQIETVVDTLLAYEPDYVMIQCMENDINNGVSQADIKAAYTSILSKCQAAGTTAIWLGCLPSLAFTGAAHNTDFWDLTEYVENLTNQMGAIYVPLWDLYLNSVAGYPQPLNAGSYANYVDATTHPIRSAVTIGRRINDVMRQYGIHGDNGLPIVALGSANYIGGNALMCGTSGTATLGGTVVDNFSATTSLVGGTLSSAASIVTVDGRNAQQIDVTCTDGQTGIKNVFAFFGTNAAGFTTGFAVGDVVQMLFEIEVLDTVAPVGLRAIYGDMAFVGSAATSSKIGGMPSGDTWNTLIIPNKRMLMVTPEFVIPAGTTGLRPYIYMLAQSGAAAVSCRAQIHSVAIVNRSA